MKNMFLSRLIVALVGISAAQLCAYEFKVYNTLNVPIRVMLPLVAELKSSEVITVPANSEASYNPQGWYAGYCLDVKKVKIALKGEDFIGTPLMSIIKKTESEDIIKKIIAEAQANNGMVNGARFSYLMNFTVGDGPFGTFELICGDARIVIIHDSHRSQGGFFAICRSPR